MTGAAKAVVVLTLVVLVNALLLQRQCKRSQFKALRGRRPPLFSNVVSTDDLEWGQSYIGQDVCGSKLNDDPFTNAGEKQAAWEDFKRRVEALSIANNATNSTNKGGGRWP